MFNVYRITKRIISHTLEAIYQPFLFALILSVFVMFFVMYLEKYKNINVRQRIRNGFRDWKNNFKESVKFRRIFYLVLIVVMILFKTLLNRNLGIHPLGNVIGVWGFYKHDGTFTTEVIENVVLFMPYIFFLFFMLEVTSKKKTKFLLVMERAVVISFLSSLTIEMLQLFLHLGTWQLSDIAFNTLGGIVGGLIYWVSAKLRRIS